MLFKLNLFGFKTEVDTTSWIAITIMIVLITVILAAFPFVIFWAINTIFAYKIAYNLRTVVAAYILLCVFTPFFNRVD